MLKNKVFGQAGGVLKHRIEWLLSSNEETGEGYCDIMIKIRKQKMGS